MKLILVEKIVGKLRNNKNVSKIFSNIGWLYSEKIIHFILGIFVNAWVARYLKPYQYGLWNYIIAFVGLFGPIASLGLDSIIIQEIVSHPDKKNEILGTSFFLKLIGSIVILFLSLLVIIKIKQDALLLYYITAITAGGYIINSFKVIDIYFQSKLLSKYTVYANTFAFIIVSVIKVILIVNKTDLIYFVITGATELALSSLFLIFAYKKTKETIFQWKYNFDIVKYLLKKSWPLLLSNFMVIIYIRTDQVMLGEMIDAVEVGFYAVANRLLELLYFIPNAIVPSIFPYLIELKKKDEKLFLARLQSLYTVLTWIGIVVCTLVTLFSGYIINLLFGDNYIPSIPIFSINVWALIFVSQGLARGKWIIIEDKQKYTFVFLALTAFINFVLNYFLIPIYKGIGAATATLISQVSATILIPFLFKATRQSSIMLCRAFVPFNEIKSLFKSKRKAEL